MKRFLQLLFLAVACVAFAAACGKSKPKVAATPAGPPTTVVPALGPVAALTGLPQADAGIRNRPVLTVKIDNHPDARPQFGIDKADVIVEEKVEGGVSRFMAMFQSEDSDRVGPVRSLRTTDPKFLKPEGGLIAYSGGIDPVKALLAPNGIVDVGADNHGSKYYKRRSDRPFEHSMYTITSVLRELTPKNAPAPKALFDFLLPGEPFGGAGATPVQGAGFRMADGNTATAFNWTWAADKKKFVRGTDGKEHDIEGVGQIAMDNVIIEFTGYAATPWRDRANSPVDEALTVGSGDAWFFSDGKIVKGKWNRPGPDDITKYSDSAGAPMKFTRGHTWISLVPPGQFTEVK